MATMHPEPWTRFAVPDGALERATEAATGAAWRVDLRRCTTRAVAPATAYVLGLAGCPEGWFLVYAYHWEGRGYVFGWETPADELVRAYGDGPREWYDGLGEGTPFAVRVDPADPVHHVVPHDPFRNINGEVCILARDGA